MYKYKVGSSVLFMLTAGLLPLQTVYAADDGAGIADSTERVFKAAKNYTVQIRTAVARPFEPDIKGTHRGAGFVVDAQRGWIMTNAHVAARSPSHIEVSLFGKPYVEARKVYVDPHLDLAILEIPVSAASRPAQASLECGDPPNVGHAVGAYGHPWNLPYTGTRGIISGVTTRQDVEMLQTDTPINAGNSGGPLISLQSGKIVGINTAQIRGSQNTNFAVAMKHACRVISLLREGKNPSPPDLQVVWYQNGDGQHSLKVAKSFGSVLGLQSGDEIVRVEGNSAIIENETQLYHALRGRSGKVGLVVKRNGHEVTLNGEMQPYRDLVTARGLVAGGVLFGLNPLLDAKDVHTGEIVVHHVDSGSDGEAKELTRGDFLESVNGEEVHGLDDLYQKLSAATGPVTLSFKRYGGSNQAFVYLERQLLPGKVEWVADQKTASASRTMPASLAGGAHNPAGENMTRTTIVKEDGASVIALDSFGR